MIRIRDIQKQFASHSPGKGFRLSITELDIVPGEIVYFLGPNASGKTTLLALIHGGLETDSGQVLLEEGLAETVDLMALPPYGRAKYLGIVPQDSDEALLNEMSISDHMLVGLSRSDALPFLFPRMRYRSHIRNIVSAFGLGFEDRLNEYAGNLSGGERQVLAFSMATINKPAIMLLDEFTSALDPEMARKVLDTVLGFLRANQLTALIVTHRHKEAIDNADRIVVLHKGQLVSDIKRGQPEFDEQHLKNVFVELYGENSPVTER